MALLKYLYVNVHSVCNMYVRMHLFVHMDYYNILHSAVRNIFFVESKMLSSDVSNVLLQLLYCVPLVMSVCMQLPPFMIGKLGTERILFSLLQHSQLMSAHWS